MSTFRTASAAALLIAALLAASPASAARQEIAVVKDWAAWSMDENGGKVCFAVTRPKKSEGKYTSRGEPFVAVTHRPAENRRDEVSFTAGYTYRKDSTVEVRIGGTTFNLITVEGDAWTVDPAADKALIAAMKQGSTMVVKGTSSRGTLTTDTYSLSGFTAAYEAASEACAK